MRVGFHELGNDPVKGFLGVDSIAMDGMWTARTEQNREEVLKTTLETRVGHAWWTDASSAQYVTKDPGMTVSIRPESKKCDCWESWHAMKGLYIHIEVIVWV